MPESDVHVVPPTKRAGMTCRRHIPGISKRMLSLTLRKLERDGLVIRTVYAEVPPRVEYELSDLATTLPGCGRPGQLGHRAQSHRRAAASIPALCRR